MPYDCVSCSRNACSSSSSRSKAIIILVLQHLHCSNQRSLSSKSTSVCSVSAAGGRPARGDLNVRVHFITINSTLIRSLSFSYRLSTTREHRKRISDQSDCRLVTRSVATSTWHWRLWRHIGGRVALHSRHTNERAAYACGRHEETTAYARDLLPSSILVVQCSASLS